MLRPTEFTDVPLARSLLRAFGAVLLVVLVLGVSSMVVLERAYSQYHQATSEALPFEMANDDALRSMINAETGVRGYVLTGDESFLDPFETGRDQLPQAMIQMRAALADDPKLAQQMEPLINDEEWHALNWMSEYGQPAITDRKNGMTAPVGSPEALLQLNTGKSLLDKFRSSNELVRQHAVADRQAREHQAQATWHAAKVLIPTGLAVALLLTAFVAWNVTRRTVGPLRRVVDGVQALHNSEEHVRVAVTGPTEVRAVAMAVNNLSKATEELRELREEQAFVEQTVKDVSQKVREHLDADVVLSRAAEGLGEALDVSHVRIVLFDEGSIAGRQLRAEYVAPGVEPLGMFTVEPAVRELVAGIRDTGSTFFIEDVMTNTTLTSEQRQSFMRLGMMSVYVEPISSDGATAGLLCIYHSNVRVWSRKERSIINAVARELELALSHARLYENQRAIVEKLTELDRTRADFVSGISHELRTPLTSIMGYSEMLLDGDAGLLNTNQTNMVQVMERNTRRLLLLIEDLLTLSRIEAGQFRAELAPTDVGSLALAVQKAMEPAAAKRNIMLDFDLAPTAPALADGGQIERVIMNLTHNAVKFSPDGSVVRIKVREQAGTITVRVQDQGMGIAPEEQDQLFKRFFRSTAAINGQVQGTGLGLAIVKTIIDSHNGTVDVQSVLGSGTTVTFALPLATNGLAAVAPVG